MSLKSTKRCNTYFWPVLVCGAPVHFKSSISLFFAALSTLCTDLVLYVLVGAALVRFG